MDNQPKLIAVDREYVPDSDPEDGARELQAMAEGVVLDDRVTCNGRSYRVREKVGALPLLRFAAAAQSGLDSTTMEGLAAMYDMLRDCIDPADFPRLLEEQTEMQASDEDVMKLVTDAMAIINARPTLRPSDSSPGPRPISATSKAASSSPAERTGPPGFEELIPVDQISSVG